MRKVFLVTGFNNWGKTKIIKDLFKKNNFSHDQLHSFPGSACNFMVMPFSNDDLHLRGYCNEYNERIKKLKAAGLEPNPLIYGLLPDCKPRLFKNDVPTEIEIAAIYSASW